MLIDNGTNDICAQALVRIDALNAVAPFAVVGLALMGGVPYLRGALFVEHSTVNALTNTYRAAALAYLSYQQKIAP